MAEYINVTTLNLLAKQVLEQCEPLNNLIVCGEVSNFTRHYKSGHCYFTLKDENAAIKCVMFRDKARLLGFAPENGMLVLAYGRAMLYERDGAFQLYCDYMRPFGAGAAQMAFDALKKKLSAEGLFDADHKRPLPPMPQCIGLVTSKTGAALQDVIHIITVADGQTAAGPRQCAGAGSGKEHCGWHPPPGCRPAPGYNFNHPRRR